MNAANLITCSICDTQYSPASMRTCPVCHNKPLPPHKRHPQQADDIPTVAQRPHPIMVQCGRCMQRYDSNTTHTCPQAKNRTQHHMRNSEQTHKKVSVSDPNLQAMLEDLAESTRQYHDTKVAYKQLKRENSVFTKLKRKLSPSRKKLPKRAHQSPEIRAIIGHLDNAALRFQKYLLFDSIKVMIEEAIASNPRDVIESVRSGERGSPEIIVNTWIANTAGDFAESGQFHMYRGVLNPMSGGTDLPKIFDAAMLELVRLGHIDSDYAKEQMAGLRRNILAVG